MIISFKQPSNTSVIGLS